MHTIGSLIQAVSDSFATAGLVYGHGTDNPWDEAVALVLHVTNAPDEAASMPRKVAPGVAEDIFDLARRRVEQRVPLAYLTGECTYMGLAFHLQPGVVVPRSPIGYLLDDGLQPWFPQDVRRIADLCCGSGCLGIIAALVFPEAEVLLVDSDPLACELAQRNATRHGLDERVHVRQADVTQLAPQDLERGNQEGKAEGHTPGNVLRNAPTAPFDLILCNPPYVDALDMKALPVEFRAEPRAGLAGGPDGLQILRPLLTALPGLLSSDGLFVGEVGASAPALLRAFPRWPFVWPDLPLGGEGVFLLEARALNSHTAGRGGQTGGA